MPNAMKNLTLLDNLKQVPQCYCHSKKIRGQIARHAGLDTGRYTLRDGACMA